MKRNPIAAKLMEQQLTQNFKLSELLVTSTGLINIPNANEVNNLKLLAVNVLQPVRDLLKTPIVINSAFRSEKVNQKVGGVSNSQHRLGFAADIQTPKMDLMEAYKLIAKSSIPYDQLIYEVKPKGVKWIHISFNPAKGRKELLLAEWNETSGKMDYKPLTV
jgi:zinc D-Ala-D-Ala carboxypeptidase